MIGLACFFDKSDALQRSCGWIGRDGRDGRSNGVEVTAFPRVLSILYSMIFLPIFRRVPEG